MRRRNFIRLVVSCAALGPGARAIAADPPKAGGLTKAEAAVVARRFVATDIRMEAAVAEPALQRDYWAFPLKVGYAGTVAKEPVLVHRFTGKASWAGSASSDAPGGGRTGPVR